MSENTDTVDADSSGTGTEATPDPSSATDIDDPEIAEEVTDIRIEDEMEQSYIDYAMSVIVGRALPDAADGLKPVQRRLLYAMHEMGVSSNSGHRKSSSVVGETMGNYHPHGDSAIYDALARMAQDFSLRDPLVDGQGNFGSMDGDPPAAMRYTEARMSPIAEELLADIDKETVAFSSNYDDRLTEPDVLPAKFPNLLVNGASGIAVGMSTNIPPHNLGEVIDGTIHLIENPDADMQDLMNHIPGPDFPTGANIVGRDGIYDAYDTGRGRVRVRADYEVIERDRGGDRIVITELPYQANKSRIIERIADDVNEGDLNGITDIRDESDRDGVRIVIDLKRGTNTGVVENELLDSHLESTFGVILLALVDGQPTVLSLKDALQHYIDHRKEVVRRRIQHELDESEERAHVLEGRLTALDHVDEVVALIQDADDRSNARVALQDRFDLSERQSDHIVRMQLGSLTSMEADEIQSEYEDVMADIEWYESVLADEEKLLDVVKEELRDVRDEYASERRTDIIEDAGTVQREDLIPEDDILVTVSADQYIKRMPVETFDSQSRNGKGIIGTGLKDGDEVVQVFTGSTHDTWLWFTENGEVYSKKGYEIPEAGRTAQGEYAGRVFDLNPDDQFVAAIPVSEFEQVVESSYVTMVTEQGYVKRTSLTEFENVFAGGIRAASVEADDRVVDVFLTEEDDDVLLATAEGQTIRFDVGDVRPMGRTARGVLGMQVADADRVVSAVRLPAGRDDVSVLFLTEQGVGKRTVVSEYRQQSRNGKGMIGVSVADGDSVVTVDVVSEDVEVVVESATGNLVRVPVADVSEYGRRATGVKVMDVDGSVVADATVV